MVENKLTPMCLVVYMLTYKSYSVCDLQSPYTISETAAAGTVIFNTTKPPGADVSFDMKSPEQRRAVFALRNSLMLFYDETTFRLENSKILDLEEFSTMYRVDIRSIALFVTCGGNTVEVFINVAEVNEFPPVFVNAPHSVMIQESMAVGVLVMYLTVSDEDVVDDEQYIFSIQKFDIIDLDGECYFSIPDSSKGEITLVKQIDYDTMEYSRLLLNLSVSDEPPSSPTAKTAYTTMEVQVADIDDQPPYFNYPDYPSCQAPQFTSLISLNYSGPLIVTPGIQGADADTLSTPLVYSIQSGNQFNLFRMDPVTGVVNQIHSVHEAGIDDREFRLVLEVKKDLHNINLSSIAILTVKVNESIAKTSEIFPSVNVNSTKDKDIDLTIPFIVVCILFAIVFVLNGLFIKYIRHQRDAKSKQQTQESANSTGNEYEQLHFSDYTALGRSTNEMSGASVASAI